MEFSTENTVGWDEAAAGERWRGRDVALLAAVPTMLVLTFSLPLGTREALAFDLTDPTLLTAYTATVVHVSLAHLLANLVGYVVVVPLAYALSVASGRRQLFMTVFVGILVAFPPVLAGLNLLFVRSSLTLGFSGVLLAFVGFLPIAIASVVEERVAIGPAEALAPALGFLGLAVVAVLGLRSVFADPTVTLGTIGLVLACLLSAALFGMTVRVHSGTLRRRLRGALATPGTGELVTAGVVVFVGVPFVAFPAHPAGPGPMVNTYVHLLSYALGFLVPYTTLAVGDRLA